MLIIFRHSDKMICSNSGTNSYLPEGPEFLQEVQNAINLYGGIPSDYGEFRLHDVDQADLVQEILNAASYELIFTMGMPTGVKITPKIKLEASPNPFEPGEIVTLTATIPLDSPDPAVSFLLPGNFEVTEPVVGGQAQHLVQFEDSGSYFIAASSDTHGTARKLVRSIEAFEG